MENTQDILQMQKENCIFCKIISKEIPSKTVFEDDISLAILDINPANEGHVLILPKTHYHIMPMVPDNELGHLFSVSQKMSQAVLKGLSVEGTTTFVANGAIAGQKAPHFMIHVIPRLKKDGLFKIPKKHIEENELMITMKKITSRHKVKLGLAKPEEPKKDVQESIQKLESNLNQAALQTDDTEKHVIPNKPQRQKNTESLDLDDISKLFT